MSKIIGKISVKTVYGAVKVRELADGDTELFQVVGIARGTKSGESTYGPWNCLVGSFRAITADGETYDSGKLFLPGSGHDIVAGMLGGGTEGVEFGLKISVHPDDDSTTGYAYSVESLIQPEESDPLEALMRKALPAPEPEPAAKKPASKATAEK